jgi:antitoxin MazE
MTIELKVVRIGNSRGVRLPAESLRRHGIGAAVVMEERVDGILLRPVGAGVGAKLSWEETAAAMAAAGESWTEFESTTGDGLEELPWRPRRAKRRTPAGVRTAPAKRRRRKP